MGTHVKTTGYIQIEPVWGGYRNPDGDLALRGAKIVGVTQKAPRSKAGVVVVKATFEIPRGAFLPLRPEAIIVVPEDMVDVRPITVTVENPEQHDDHEGGA